MLSGRRSFKVGQGRGALDGKPSTAPFAIIYQGWYEGWVCLLPLMLAGALDAPK